MTRRTYSDLNKPAELSPEEREIDRTVFAALTTREGRDLVDVLDRLFTFKRNGASDSDGALRWSEAQRSVVAILKQRRDRHSTRVTTSPEAKQNVGPGNEPEPRKRRTRS